MRAVNLLPRDAERTGSGDRRPAARRVRRHRGRDRGVRRPLLLGVGCRRRAARGARVDRSRDRRSIPARDEPGCRIGHGRRRSAPIASPRSPPLSRRASPSTGCCASSRTFCPRTPGSRASSPTRRRSADPGAPAGGLRRPRRRARRRDDPGSDVLARVGRPRARAPLGAPDPRERAPHRERSHRAGGERERRPDRPRRSRRSSGRS